MKHETQPPWENHMVTTAVDLTGTDADLLALHDRFHSYDFTPDDYGAVKVHHELTAELAKRGLDHGHTDDTWARATVEVESLQVDLTLVKAEALPLDLVAAIMEAQRFGIHTADIVTFLNVNGYEVRVVPAGVQAGEPFPVADYDAAYERDDEGEDGDMAAAKADTYSPPDGVREAAQRALDWIKEGKAGSGFTDVGRARAAQLARGDAVSADTIRRMNSYFSRHEPDKRATGFNAGEDGFPTPGRVAWDAWGGDAGQSWARRIAGSLDKGRSFQYENEVISRNRRRKEAQDPHPFTAARYVTRDGRLRCLTCGGLKPVEGDVCYGLAAKGDPGVGDVHVDGVNWGRRRRTKDDMGEMPDTGDMGEAPEPEGFDPEDMLTGRQQAMYEAYEAIADAYGPWGDGEDGDGAHYMEDNPFADRGINCANCVFYEGGGGCEILNRPVNPNAVCKLWVIPEDLIGEAAPTEAVKSTTLVMQKSDERRFTLGPWYVPDTLDAHGEWTDSTELQSALWGYVRSGDRGIRLQHNRAVVAGEWVECMTWPYEVTVPMTLPDGTTRKVTYPPETVFLGVVWEPWAWEYVKSGRVLGYSIGGRAERLMVDLPGEDDN